MFSKNYKNIPPNIPYKKKELAPTIFFIDILKSKSYNNPIIPFPSRIDKISNGKPISIILPEKSIYIEDSENGKILAINLEKLVENGLSNLVDYSKDKYFKICYRVLDDNKINQALEDTIKNKVIIQNFSEDVEIIYQSYLDHFLNYLKGADMKLELLNYCEDVINLCNKRLDQNNITFQYKKKIVEKPIYIKKKEKIYPFEWEIDLIDKLSNTISKKKFIPILIYDDLLECFMYNKEFIKKDENAIISFEDIRKREIISYMRKEEYNFDKHPRISDFLININKIIKKESL